MNPALGAQVFQQIAGVAVGAAGHLEFIGEDGQMYMFYATDFLDYTVDRSPHKQGKFSPAFNLPILPPQKLMERQIPYALLLTWNFAREILDQNTEWSRKGGLWIEPLPGTALVNIDTLHVATRRMRRRPRRRRRVYNAADHSRVASA